jgi:hypothetical protein
LNRFMGPVDDSVTTDTESQSHKVIGGYRNEARLATDYAESKHEFQFVIYFNDCAIRHAAVRPDTGMGVANVLLTCC